MECVEHLMANIIPEHKCHTEKKVFLRCTLKKYIFYLFILAYMSLDLALLVSLVLSLVHWHFLQITLLLCITHITRLLNVSTTEFFPNLCVTYFLRRFFEFNDLLTLFSSSANEHFSTTFSSNSSNPGTGMAVHSQQRDIRAPRLTQ